MTTEFDLKRLVPIDPKTQDVSLDDVNKQDRLRTRESKYFPWFGGNKIVHYYVMKDKD